MVFGLFYLWDNQPLIKICARFKHCNQNNIIRIQKNLGRENFRKQKNYKIPSTFSPLLKQHSKTKNQNQRFLSKLTTIQN
jgi:hypothetical protein